MFKTVLERIYRAAGASAIGGILVPMIPGVLQALPPPWNLVVTVPALMAVSKWARDTYPDKWWVKLLPS